MCAIDVNRVGGHVIGFCFRSILSFCMAGSNYCGQGVFCCARLMGGGVVVAVWSRSHALHYWWGQWASVRYTYPTLLFLPSLRLY